MTPVAAGDCRITREAVPRVRTKGNRDLVDFLRHGYRRCMAKIRAAPLLGDGIRQLSPREQRSVAALFAMLLRVRAAAHSAFPEQLRLQMLECIRGYVWGHRFPPQDAVGAAFVDTCQRYGVPTGVFDRIINGYTAEVAIAGHLSDDWEGLEWHCRSIAGAFGESVLPVVGVVEVEEELVEATHLVAVGMHITELLDHVEEDWMGGRAYIPVEVLDRHRISEDTGGPAEFPCRWHNAIREVALMSDTFFDETTTLIRRLPRRAAACASSWVEAHRARLHRITNRTNLRKSAS